MMKVGYTQAMMTPLEVIYLDLEFDSMQKEFGVRKAPENKRKRR